MAAPKPKGAVEATIDSVGTAIGMLWDWLGDPPETKDGKRNEPSILDLLPSGEEKKEEPKVRARVVIDTDGEDV